MSAMLLRSARLLQLRDVCGVRHSSSLRSLQAAFKDPSSPFYLAPGTQGPDSPDAPPSQNQPPHSNFSTSSVTASLGADTKAVQGTAEEEAKEKLLELGYDLESFWEQKIVWGDHDSMQHVNNVRYLRFLESSRVHWMNSIAMELGGPQRASDMSKGKGVSLILKSITLNYKRPVTYPDTLLIAHKPLPPPAPSPSHPPSSHSHNAHLTQFNLDAIAYSYAQRSIVLTSSSVLVWYDYDTLKKCDPGEEARKVVWGRCREGRVM
ncbi:hypothetical protein JAAARDRAFT_31417 [Jaapia argillacea MUCL 33604]|uniref:Thioesterase domain-containing protein n=1 Tax=Jaapia argillacea MUCL 33604 TaxID=933084 RepID=A0A067Q719_9AGAM|nr:hypothetical protein JAAARDRAFT_31417 [Jaapia argillacea MUCL 33604]